MMHRLVCDMVLLNWRRHYRRQGKFWVLQFNAICNKKNNGTFRDIHRCDFKWWGLGYLSWMYCATTWERILKWYNHQLWGTDSGTFSSGKLPGLISYQQLLSLSFNHWYSITSRFGVHENLIVHWERYLLIVSQIIFSTLNVQKLHFLSMN